MKLTPYKKLYEEKDQKHTSISPKKYKKRKKLGAILKTGAITMLACLSSNAILRSYGTSKNNDYLSDNQIFEVGKIDNSIDFFGGDERYIARTLNAFTHRENIMYNHFNTQDNSNIKVGISDQFTHQEKEQIQIYYDYLNSIFKVINPSYNFVVGDFSQSKSSIYLCKENLPKNTGAQCTWKNDWIINSRIEKATIRVNQNITISNQALKIYLAHEMMHALLGSKDIDYQQSNTFSVYNYDDCAFMIDQLENAVEKEPNSWHVKYPVMNEEEKNIFVSYTPVDVAALIAVYGKGGTDNQKKYIELMKQTLDTCGKVYGDNQPFFEKSFDFGELADKYLDSEDFSK